MIINKQRMSKKWIYTTALLAFILIITSCQKKLEKDFHNGSFAFELPDTTVYFNYHNVLNVTYDQLGEGTNIHFYGDQYDSLDLDYYHFEFHFWNSGVYQTNTEYLEGELNTGNYCQGYIDAADSTHGTYIFDGSVLSFEQVDETRVKGTVTGEYHHWSDLIPATCYFEFTQ
jgi:hypothetical protein